jgi:hypothetical protein
MPLMELFLPEETAARNPDQESLENEMQYG